MASATCLILGKFQRGPEVLFACVHQMPQRVRPATEVRIDRVTLQRRQGFCRKALQLEQILARVALRVGDDHVRQRELVHAQRRAAHSHRAG